MNRDALGLLILRVGLAGFAALWLLRRHDHWSMDEWLKAGKS